MKLSVIVPCYNERTTIREIIKRVQAVPIEKEIIVVDDGSTDGTRNILQEIQKEYDNIQVILQPQNRGKGYAFRTGLNVASGEVVIIQDADLEYDPNDFLKILELFKNPEVKVVYGSRILNPANEKSYLSFYLGGRLVTFITNVLFKSNLTDEPTCYKAFRLDFIKSIPMVGTGFEFEPEITAKILKRGVKIYEVPISYFPRKAEEGKKIKWKDGLLAIWTLLKYRIKD